jgi:hypothetical protein
MLIRGLVGGKGRRWIATLGAESRRVFGGRLGTGGAYRSRLSCCETRCVRLFVGRRVGMCEEVLGYTDADGVCGKGV